MTSVLLDAKLTPPPGRPGSLIRKRLLDRVRADPHRVVTVTAPAGYGKSTFLRQWAEHEDRGVAWVSFEPTDDDETAVLRYIATALDRVESIGAAVLGSVAQARGSLRTAALTRLGAAIWRMTRPTVLMLDDVDHLRSAGSVDALTWLAEHLPPLTCLAVSGRSAAPLPLGRLRARGQLYEIGPADLALSPDEARAVMEQAGVRLSDERIAEIIRRTEGWPAGVYMAALSHRAGLAEATRPSGGGGSERFAAQFLRSELLDRLAPDRLSFLLRTAPLTRFDASLCDHVLGTTGSAEVLADLERTNQFLVPLDHLAAWHRYHHVFRDVLLAELRRREPGEEAVILARAAAWSADHDDTEAAIEYAHQAGDDELVARLLTDHALRLYRAGRLATLERWFGWFDDDRLGQRPRLAVLGTWVWLLTGRTGRAERWADSVAPSGLEPIARAWFATLRSVMGRMTQEELQLESRLAVETIPVGDPWRATAYLGAGVLALQADELDAADAALSRAVDIGLDNGAIPASTAALGVRAHIACERGDWGYAEELIRRARSMITQHGLEGYVTSTLAWTVSARVSVHRGARDTALADIALAQRLRPLLTAGLPALAALVRLDLARAYLSLGEVAGARLMLSETEEVMAVRPGVASFAAEIADLRARAGAIGGGRPGVATLTTAELRLLGYLPSHLSFREIAERLFVSVNTVKTQAISIYGKLGVSSRAAAIDEAVATGLLDPSANRFPTTPPDVDLTRHG